MERKTCSICGGSSFTLTPFVNLMGLGANYILCADCGVGCYDRTITTPVEAYDNPACHALAEKCLKFGSMCSFDESKTEMYRQFHKTYYSERLATINAMLAPEPMRRIYEIGSNIADFLQIAQDDFGCEVEGCEPNGRAVEIAKSRGVKLEHAFFQQAHPTSPYDAVLMMDVLEHTSTPMEDLIRAHSILKPSGILLLKTFYEEFHVNLNPEALQTSDAWSLGLDKKGYFDPIQHVFHFTKEVLCRTIEHAGFRIESTIDNEFYGQRTIFASRGA